MYSDGRSQTVANRPFSAGQTKAFAGQVECKQLVSNCAAGYSSPPNYARAGCTFEYVNNPEIHTALELAGLTASP